MKGSIGRDLSRHYYYGQPFLNLYERSDNMRIISGKYRGRVLKGFDIEGTRPTMDRVKESLFAMIQDQVKESICLDLFAGSGNLGIEALSNGAKECYFVDHNKFATKTMKENMTTLKLEHDDHILTMDYMDALHYFERQQIQFDIVFLDPPYGMNVISPILSYIIDHHLLTDKGIIICEYEKEEPTNNQLTVWKERKYGSKKIRIYRNC